MSIVIVDDDPAALNSLRFLLESDGHEVLAFQSGAELLSAAPASEPACYIIDYMMPGMNGLDLWARLRGRGLEAPAIVITGHPDPAIRTKGQGAGVQIIDKPLSQELLLKAVIGASRGSPWRSGSAG